NPGFEAPSAVGSTSHDCAGWNVLLDTDRANFGNVPHHLPGTTWSVWAKTFEPLGGGVTQNVGITGGTSYTLSGFTFYQDGYFQSGATIQMGMIWLDGSNNPVGTPAALNIDPTSAPTINTWLSNSFTGLAPVNATQVMVSLGWSGGQTAATQPQSAFF